MFSRAFVINLPFKTDRLKVFQDNVPKCLGIVDVWPAVHGDAVRHPDWWTAGSGAWGCYRSHMQILEHCYQNKVESYVVFEDDAIFRADFEPQFERFMAAVPKDWEQIYLGGQLYHEAKHPPRKVSDQVYVPYNVNRTHCFAVHRRGYEKLYKFLNATPFANQEHIDHHLGRLHESRTFKVYCPARWLVGQDSGPSNISGKNNGATYWVDPERCSTEHHNWQTKPALPIFLESPIEVAIELERRGWHRGHWQNHERLDRGVCNALGSMNVKAGLTGWYKSVMPEAVREGNPCICLYHPNLTWACVESLECAHFHRIVASTAEEAEHQLSTLQAQQTSSVSVGARRRNLIYHIWPRKGNGVWQWNVDQLLERIEQFDGVRSIAIVTSDEADAVEDVRRRFAGARIDNWIVMPNDPHLGEATTFLKLLATLPHDNSITFRGHAKGVKYAQPEATRAWTEMIYQVCLDDLQYVDASLNQFPVAGPFTCSTPWAGGAKHQWYFSGAFYWFRNADVFAQPGWSDIRQDYWGAELWPGSLFPRSQCGELFGQECGNLYKPEELSRMQEWLKEWKVRRRT